MDRQREKPDTEVSLGTTEHQGPALLSPKAWWQPSRDGQGRGSVCQVRRYPRAFE